MKIAIGGLACECCTFSPLINREEDFSIWKGADLLKRYPFISSYAEVTAVPLFYASAIPGGPVEAQFYIRAKKDFLQRLEQNGPFDGIFLNMHGAVYIEGMEDAEGDFLTSIRSLVGPNCFIAASYDLHGNVSPRVMQSVDFLSAYRTAPHIDWYETVERVFSVLVKCVSSGVKPYKTFIPVPVLFSGENTSTEWEPAGSLYRKIPGVISGDGVIDASILIGYVWADEPRSSGCVTAFGMDRDKVDAAARYLAQQFWDVRSQFKFGVTADSVDNCIQIAQLSPEQSVVISDSGDNPTAGGADDTPFVLERMVALGVKDAIFASIADAEAVQKCEAAGSGSSIELSLGGKLDPIHARPLPVKGQVKSLHVLPWTLNRQVGTSILNHIAVVDVQGILVIVTQRRTPFHHISDFTSLGIDPYQHKIVVVKIGYLEPELKKLAAKALLALSPGAVNQDTVSIKYEKIHRPMYPFDTAFDWAP